MRKINFGIIQFPGSNCEQDCFHVLSYVLKQNCRYIWHDTKTLKNIDCVIVPGGFSYGDYLRTGAIAAQSNISLRIKEYAEKGGLVLGICNGFQILTELELLPGVLLRNKSLNFICKDVSLKTINNDSVFTSEYKLNETLKIPIAHAEGNFFVKKSEIKNLKKNNQIIFQYSDDKGLIDDSSNPNGSFMNIAAISNKKGNVMGMMPHPERVSENLLGGLDGKGIFKSIIKNLS